MTKRNTSLMNKKHLLEVFQSALDAFLMPEIEDAKTRNDIQTHMAHLAQHIGVLDSDAELDTDAATGQTSLKIIITPGTAIKLAN